MKDLYFPVGIWEFHKDGNFNFQFNRTVAHGGHLDEVREMAAKVTDIPSYIRLMEEAEEKARQRGDRRAEMAYLRAHEFFTTAAQGKADKYQRWKKLFYESNGQLMKDYRVQYAEVPYENGFLPVMYAVNENPKGVVVLHGGYDSYYEEHLKIALHMYRNGYSAYIFEGPGQGSVIYEQGIPFTHEWYKPVSAVLDHFGLDDVALMGISLGSVLCKIAAAKEPRIKYLCGVGYQADLYGATIARMPKTYAEKVSAAVEREDRDAVNDLLHALMDSEPIYSWYLNQGLLVFGVETPYDYLVKTKDFSIKPIADEIKQDYLLVVGQADHFFSNALLLEEIEYMKSVRSFTMRIVTTAEKGQNHCNIGNRKLMIDIFMNWLEETKREHVTAAREGWL